MVPWNQLFYRYLKLQNANTNLHMSISQSVVRLVLNMRKILTVI